MGALFLKPDELCILNDIGPIDECLAMLTTFRPGTNNVYLRCRSAELLAQPVVREHAGSFRWVHVDGDHTGYSTFRDLETAASLVHSRGIICVDDFMNFRYPQLSAAVYRFLFANSFRFKIVLCGDNKAYICEASSYDFYESLVRRQFSPKLRQHGCQQVQLNKSSCIHDFGCFSFSRREGERTQAGPDAEPDRMPF